MIRKTISLTAAISFILLLISSVMLYIVPEGRVAYWSDWSMFGLSKSQWGNLHITVGLLFIIVAIWHLLLNWKPIINYIRKGVAKAKIRPTPIILAVVINVFVVWGTMLGFQPMKQILKWNSDIKTYQSKVNGNPPYGHAELSSLESFCGFLGLDKEIVVDALKEKGLKGDITLKTTILEIARANQITPQKVYELIQESAGTNESKGMGNGEGVRQGDGYGAAPQGLGKMTLAEVCSTYGYNLDTVVKALEKQGVKVVSDKTMKEIASDNGIMPMELFQKIEQTKK